MEARFLTFDYFVRTILDPMFELFEVLDNVNHKEHEKLMIDIHSIDQFELDHFVKEKHIDHFLDGMENKDIGRRAYFLINQLQKDIAKCRIT